MLFVFLGLFVFLPIGEIYLFAELGDVLGGSKIFLEVLLTGFFGLQIMRGQGIHFLQDLQQSGMRGQSPSVVMLKGLFQFMGGLLLFVPGVFTDLIGLSFLLPGFRLIWMFLFIRWWARAMKKGNVHVYAANWSRGYRPSSPTDSTRADASAQAFSSASTEVLDAEVIDIQKKTTTD